MICSEDIPYGLKVFLDTFGVLLTKVTPDERVIIREKGCSQPKGLQKGWTPKYENQEPPF